MVADGRDEIGKQIAMVCQSSSGVEQRTHKPLVAGSIPASGTTSKKHFVALERDGFSIVGVILSAWSAISFNKIGFRPVLPPMLMLTLAEIGTGILGSSPSVRSPAN